MNRIKFSVIVPVYNVELYLEECLESILRQSYTNFEVICVEDMSTDGSLNILQRFALKDPRVQVIQNESNRGLSYSRNRGMEVVKGDYIVFVDSDDWIKDNMLEILEKELSQEEVDILYYNMQIVNEGTWAKEKGEQHVEYRNYEGVFSGQELFVSFYKNEKLKIEVWRQAYKAEFIKEHQLTFYDGIFQEDNLFSILAAMKAERVKNINDELYIYRRRNGSTMSQMTAKRMQSFFVVYVELLNYWKNHKFSEEVNWMFEDYLGKLYRYIQKMKSYFPDEKELQYGDSADKFLYSLMCDSEPDFEFIAPTVGQLEIIQQAKEVYVYGAGGVGIEVVRYLKKQKIEIKEILVTSKMVNPDEILGVPIVEIAEAVICRDALIIIAILKDNERAICEIENTLRKMDLTNMVVLDNK